MPSPRVNWIISATDKVSATVKGIDDRLGRLGDTFRTIGTVAIGAAAVRSLTNLARSTLEWGDRLDDLSQRTGIAQDTLQGFEYAAGQTGTTLEAVSKSIVKLARSGDDANRGLQEYAEAFQRLGINAADLVKLPLDEQFFRVADAVAALGTESEQLALGQRLLGRGFAEILPSIKRGTGELRKFFDESKRLGGLTRDQIQAIGDANDAWARLSTALGNLAKQTIAPLSGALEELANTLAFRIGAGAKEAGDSVGDFAEHLRKLNNVLKPLQPSFGFLADLQKYSWEARAEGVRILTDAFVTFASGVAVAGRILGRFVGGNVADDLSKEVDQAKYEINQYIRAVRELYNLDNEVNQTPKGPQGPRTLGTLQGKLERDIRAAAARIGEAIDIEPPDLNAIIRAWEDSEKAAKSAADALVRDAERIYQQTRTPLESYRAGIDEVSDLLGQKLISADTARRKIQLLGAELGEATQAFVESTEAGRRWKQALEDVADITDETQTPLERLEAKLKRIAELRAPSLPKIVTDGSEARVAAKYAKAADDIETELLRIGRLPAPSLPAIEATGTEAAVVQQYGAAVDRAVDQVSRELARIGNLPAPQLPPVEGEIAGDIVGEYRAIGDVIAREQERIGNLPPTVLPPLVADRSEIAAVIDYLSTFDLVAEKYDNLAKTLARLGELEARGVLDADIAADARNRAFGEVIGKAGEVVTAYEAMERKYIELQKLFDKGLIGRVSLERGKIEAQSQYMKDLEAQAGDTTDRVTEILEQIKNATDGVARDITAAFFDSTKSIGDAFENMLDRIAQSIIEKNVVQPIIDSISGAISNASASGGGGLGGFFKSLFGRAQGGPVSRGTPYLVGEEGPELFIPQQSGRVAANGAGSALNITFNVNSLDPSSAAAVIAANERVITNVIRRAQTRAGYAPTV